MTTYTTPHNLPLIDPAVDPIKDGAEVSSLAADINAVAQAANTAVATEGARAQTAGTAAAIADATSKYGGLSTRMTSAESKNTNQDARLDSVESVNAGQAGYLATINNTTIPAAKAEAISTAKADATAKADNAKAVAIASIAVPKGPDITAALDVNTLPMETIQRKIPSGAVAAASTGLPSPYPGTLTQVVTGASVGYRTYGTFGSTDNNRSAGLWFQLRLNSTTWGPWAEMGGRTTWGNIGATAAAPINLDTYRRPGLTQVNNQTAVDNTANLPVQLPGVLVNNIPTDTAAFWGQLYFAYGPTEGHGLYWRVSSNVAGAWHPWEKVPTIADIVPPAPVEDNGPYQHLMRANDMQRRRFNRVTEPGVVVLIFDHGLTNFKATEWPLLQSRGLPVTVALNPDQMGSAQNSGATYADVQAWAATGLVEPANHSKNHVGGTTSTQFDTEIRVSREILETEIGQRIDTWVHPGNVFGDFTVDNNPDHYWATEAGRMILANHGAVTGLLDAGTLPIGMNTIGAAGVWMDNTGTVAGMQNAINNAVTKKGIQIIRHHPQFLNDAGKLTTAELTAFLDWLKSEQDAGRVKVLTFRDAMSATR